jgi:hypothetical protein
MRKVSMATRKELIEAVGTRYRACDRSSKGKVLDEFVAVTGFHRKHAMRVLRQEALDRTGHLEEPSDFGMVGREGSRAKYGPWFWRLICSCL